MNVYTLNSKNELVILSLGAESAGNFAFFKSGTIFHSQDFGNLQEEETWKMFQKELFLFLKKEKIKPSIILSDLHPEFVTTKLAQSLAKKYKAKYFSVQHHHAHVFSAIGDRFIQNSKFKIQNSFLGIACDGTGYSDDGTIWGGEIFEFKISNLKFKISRIAHLENQVMIGAEKAIQQPARMLIAILKKFLSKNETYTYIKKHYSKNEFELLWNQLQQNFNCLETSSTARILDAVSVLLGFSKNESLEKHGPVKLLEENSTKPYNNLKPKIDTLEIQNTKYQILNTTYLFEYLIKNLHKDKKRLAATAQKYIADGLLEITKTIKNKKTILFSGGMANNKIISEILEKQGIYTNKKIPRGDAGISMGQIFYHLLTNSRH
jgi:hydrogenase maturation protein HypF